MAETEVDAEVTETPKDEIWLSDVVVALEIETTADGKISLVKRTEDAAEEAVTLTISCVCSWSAVYL